MEVIEKARKRVADLEAELSKLQDFIAVYDALEEALSEIPMDSSTLKRESKRIRGGSSPAEIVRVAKQVLLEKGRPMTRTKLVEELEFMGLKIGGSDKAKNMGTILWRSDQFYNIEGHGYWPNDAPKWDESDVFN